MRRRGVRGPGIRRMGNAVFAGAVHGLFDLRGAPSVMRERPPVCVTGCKSLYDHLLAVESSTTLQDKRSAVDVLIIRESLKKTGCVIRWAPIGLLLADGLTKDKGEAVECLRRSLRSGRIASHKVSSHQRDLECFADSSSIPWNPPTIFRPDLIATVPLMSLPQFCALLSQQSRWFPMC